MPRRLTSSAMSRVLQRDWPSGGGPHTRATTAASWLLSSLCSGFGRGSSLSACCNPLFRYRLATRDISRGYPPTAIAVPRTVCPPSRSRSTRTRRQIRTFSGFLLRCIRASSARSAADSFSPEYRVVFFTLRYRSNLDPERKNFVIDTRRDEH
jgi:hypothetical protein